MNKARRLVMIALFSALLGIFSQLSLPTPTGIPLTLQTFAVALCGRVLGWSYGGLSVLVWLALGAVGLPLFSGFRGGVSVLLGPTGGFAVGFLFLVCLCGLQKKRPWIRFLFGSLGLMLCHLSGILWFCFITKQSIFAAVLSTSLPYLLKDFLSLAAAEVCAEGMLRILPSLQKN